MPEFRILVADDQANNRETMQRVLLAFKCQPVLAASGREAVQAFQNDHSIALIIMDIRMPGGNGIETVAEIRRLGRAGLKVPVVMLTAADYPEIRRSCRAVGANDFLTKPVNPRQLLDTLRQHLPDLGKPANPG